jgi:transcriptional regulator with XRE-family HTH domain
MGTVARSPRDIDRYIGARIRTQRTMLGLTQQQMATSIGVTSQQVHKYECGVNRVSAPILYNIACVLAVNINSFFEEYNGPSLPRNYAVQHNTLEFVRLFVRIPNEKHQRALYSVVQKVCR